MHASKSFQRAWPQDQDHNDCHRDRSPGWCRRRCRQDDVVLPNHTHLPPPPKKLLYDFPSGTLKGCGIFRSLRSSFLTQACTSLGFGREGTVASAYHCSCLPQLPHRNMPSASRPWDRRITAVRATILCRTVLAENDQDNSSPAAQTSKILLVRIHHMLISRFCRQSHKTCQLGALLRLAFTSHTLRPASAVLTRNSPG